MAEQSVISTLNTLIETCRDGEAGFRNAAENLEDQSVKSLFNEFARERAACADELRGEVQRLGGQPEESGSVSGALHRGWMDVKGSLTGRDDATIIAEAERGEDVAVATFRDALRQDLPSSVQPVVQRTYAHVKDVHDRVHALEEQHKHRP
jgi:uncharacterized protein (TIGR02284 family)